MRILLCLFVALSTPGLATKSIHTLKVVTFNTMLVCVGPWCSLAGSPEPEERAKKAGQWIANSKADLVFLQETFKEKHFDILADATAFPYRYFVGHGTGLSLLSKYPVKDSIFELYQWQGAYVKDCKRLFARLKIGLLTASLDVGDKRIAIALTHTLPRYTGLTGFSWKADANTPQRLATLMELLSQLESKLPKRTPFILAGDLNMNQKSKEYEFAKQSLGLVDGYRSFLKNDRRWRRKCTYCAQNRFVKEQGNRGEGILDYVFLSPGDFEVKSARIEKATDAFSDHRAVSLTLSLTGKQHGYRPRRLLEKDVQSVRGHIERVPIHAFCWFAPMLGWTQRSSTLAMLDRLLRKP